MSLSQPLDTTRRSPFSWRPSTRFAYAAIGGAALVLLPLLALGLSALFGLGGELRAAAVYESAMPPMITAGALLSLAGLEAELAAAMVGFGLVASMATLPLWHWLLAG